MSKHPKYVQVRTRQGRRESITVTGVTDFGEIAKRTKVIRQVAARLAKAGRADKVLDLCAQIAAAKSEKLVALILRAVDETIATESVAPEAVTIRQHADDWVSERIHARFPDYVKKIPSIRDYEEKLRLYVLPLVGDIPVAKFVLEDAERVMRKIPEARSSATRRHVAQAMYRLMRIAVFPCKLIAHNPLPSGFLPKIVNARAKQYLYPDEESQLLGCRKVSLEYRVAYGVLAREGMRAGELLGNAKMGTTALEWSDFDLARGVIKLDRNKTHDPRAWVMDPSTTRALAAWKRRSPRHPFAEVDPNHFADRFREHLMLAKVDRHELHAPTTHERRPIRGHDLRATFITLAFAAGKTEAWIQDRTGHTSSTMVNRYRRLARTFAELGLGGLRPMDRAIGELGRNGGKKVAEKSSKKKGRAA